MHHGANGMRQEQSERVAEFVREAMGREGLTITEAAKAWGLSRGCVRNLAIGQSAYPCSSTVSKICQAVGLAPHDFYTQVSLPDPLPPEQAGMTASAFGARLRKLRMGRGLGVKQLARVVGLSHATISLLERGARGFIEMRQVEQLAAGLGVPADQLLPAMPGGKVRSRWIPLM